jgi:hypothetical protein
MHMTVVSLLRRYHSSARLSDGDRDEEEKVCGVGSISLVTPRRVFLRRAPTASYCTFTTQLRDRHTLYHLNSTHLRSTSLKSIMGSISTPRVLPSHLHAFAPNAHPTTTTVRLLGIITTVAGDQATLTCGSDAVTIILNRFVEEPVSFYAWKRSNIWEQRFTPPSQLPLRSRGKSYRACWRPGFGCQGVEQYRMAQE